MSAMSFVFNSEYEVPGWFLVEFCVLQTPVYTVDEWYSTASNRGHVLTYGALFVHKYL